MTNQASLNEVVINGITYVPKESITEYLPVVNTENMEYCIVRTYSAGVFAGYVESRNGGEAVLRNARRIWYWEGAASLSQLAVDGTSKPQNCKFPAPVDKVILTEVIEILSVTKKAWKSINEVSVWKY